MGFREWKTVGVLLCANWLIAALMIFPMLRGVFSAWGHAPRAVGKPLVSPPLLLHLGSLLETGNRPSALAPLLFLLVLQTFLAGGVVWRACAGGSFRLGAFFGQCGRLVGRCARLYLWLLLVLPVAAVVPALVALVMHALGLPTLFTIPGETWAFGSPFSVWSLLHLGVVVIAIALWRLSLDVGRVLLFREDVRATRRAAWRAVRLVIREPRALLLYTVLGALATALVLLVARGRASLPEGKVRLALLALVVAQVALWIRFAFQVAGTRFAAALVERAAAAGPGVVPTESSPVEPAPVAPPAA